MFVCTIFKFELVDILYRIHTKERERRMDFVPEKSVLDVDEIKVSLMNDV